MEMGILSQGSVLYSKNNLRANLEDVLYFYTWNNPGNCIKFFIVGDPKISNSDRFFPFLLLL